MSEHPEGGEEPRPDATPASSGEPVDEQAASEQAEGETAVSETVESPGKREHSGPPSREALQAAKRAIEAIVLVATDPIEDQLLAQLLELPVPVVRVLCGELAESYKIENRGFQFVEVAGGWRYQTHPEMAPYVERYVLEGQTARLSSAALETLSIVAYKQPVSRAQVSAIRGVNVDGVLRTLVQKGYVEEKGKDVGPGQATLFGTTQLFLERLGLGSISDLPPLGEFVPDADIVEALEMTLRVAPEEPQLPLDGDPADNGNPSSGSALPVGNEPAETDTSGMASPEPIAATGLADDSIIDLAGTLDDPLEEARDIDIEDLGVGDSDEPDPT